MRKMLAALGFGLALSVGGAAHAQTDNPAARSTAREIFAHIVAMDTSINGLQTPAMAQFLAQRFRAGGFAPEDVTIVPVENTAALVVRYRGDGTGGRPILLLGHMDVVTAVRSDWERDPFTLVEENGFFFGRGASDNKAGIALLTTTFLQLRAEGFTPTRDLILVFSGDEETTTLSTRTLLRDHRQLLGDAEFALNSDGGGGDLRESDGAPSAYYIQTAEKTFATFTLTARNPGGHSSAPRPDNAIFDLTEAITRLRAYAFPVMWNETTLASFRAGATAAPAPLAAALRRFAERPSAQRGEALQAQAPTMAGQLRTTCVPTRLAAGHADNALPQSAVATVNCRIFPGVAVNEVQAQLQRLAGAQVEVTLRSDLPATDASPLRPDILEAIATAVHARHPGVPLIPMMAPYYTDGMFYRAAGIPTYGVGEIFMKNSDAFAHGLNERVPVEAFYNGLDHWRLLIGALAGPR
ncbi:MAG: M20/M25/M40 family metallo-hydrolase [Hyphomonadaceae bacterium]|nr:M20/M25/M40 family metallo-hydrolase [Hyphomonadaceae bacterium]MBX3510630.1 M20/M25/M40 family metallo-hydrolase [Hyphomonadaceae bacterium]